MYSQRVFVCGWAELKRTCGNGPQDTQVKKIEKWCEVREHGPHTGWVGAVTGNKSSNSRRNEEDELASGGGAHTIN